MRRLSSRFFVILSGALTVFGFSLMLASNSISAALPSNVTLATDEFPAGDWMFMWFGALLVVSLLLATFSTCVED